MAERSDAPQSRHVGKVIDPLARDDGGSEPALSIDATVTERPPQDPAPTTDAGGEVARGERMRERLLERAASAERQAASPPPTPLDDLDEVGRRARERSASYEPEAREQRAPGAPLAPARSSLSPTVVALFGTLMGMAVVASVAAVAMHIAPRRAEVPEAPPVPALAASAPTAEPAPKPKAKKRERKRLPGPYRVSESASDPNLRLIEGTIGREPFIRAVTEAGVPLKETYRVITAFEGIRNLDQCNRKDRFLALVDRQTKRLRGFEYIVSEEEVYQAREGADGLLGGLKLDLKVERTQIAGSFVYDGKSLDDSAEQAGFERGLARVVLKALDGHAAVEDLERGDVFRVVVQEVTVLGDFARYAGVEALEYRSKKGEPLRVYYLDVPEDRGYYDVKGRSPHDGGWRKPIPGAPITSRFNLKRMHPVLKKVMPHLGTDFGAPTGTPVGSTAPGKVSYIGYAGPSGNLVKIEHAGGIETGYAHLSRFAEGLKVGARVGRLQVIGYVGSTGRSTGPHLHFSASKSKEYFDPEKLNLDAMRTLRRERRALLDQVITKYDGLLEGIALPETLPDEPPDPAVAAESASARLPALPPPEQAEEEDDDREPPPPLAAPPEASAPRRASSNIYLTDQELMKIQGATDDGEVAP